MRLDSWPRLGWQHERRIYLANKGEECYAFLSYLRDMYDYLPDAVLFFQGDGVLGGAGFEAKRARSRRRCMRWRRGHSHGRGAL